jgi:hypothetical protein
MATKKLPEWWTKTHDTVLSGLTGMGLGKGYATSLLSGMKETDAAQMIRAALQSHTKSKNLSPVPGGPQNAVPIVPQPGPAGPAAAQVSGAPPAQVRPAPSLRSFVPQRPASAAGAQTGPRIDLRSFIPKGPSQAAAAPAAPEVVPATQKPRIRIQAAGRRIPAAPLGSPTEAAQSPTQGPQTPSKPTPPLIHTAQEYEQLAPGTEFIWRSDGHIYEKPAEEGK